jgi:hypothetical protein
MPRLAFLVAKRQHALIELAHWFYGAGGGAAFTMLPDSVRRRNILAGLGYGLLTTLLFELGIAPILGLDKAKKIRPSERLMFTADHLLYGLILAEGEKRALPEKRRRWLR